MYDIQRLPESIAYIHGYHSKSSRLRGTGIEKTKHLIDRMRKIKVLLIGLLYLHPIDQAQNKSEPVRVIFDSDMGPDYDHVGAITLLHSFADSGKANILATIASTKYEGVAAVFEVLNTYFNRPNIPI